MSLREELIQVAAVAVAIVTDLDGGSTRMFEQDDDGTEYTTDAHQNTISAVIGAVIDERVGQEFKWGERRSVPIAEWLVILGEEYGEACQAALEEVMYPKESDCPVDHPHNCKEPCF